MSGRKRASGISLIGFLMLLGVIGFFGYLAMRLVPMYSGIHGDSEGNGALASRTKCGKYVSGRDPTNLVFKFSTQYVDDAAIPPQAIRIVRENNAMTFTITYERRVPFLYNLELLGNFDKTMSLSNRNGE
ncbi:MAG: DUF4845 domain-containing protein [Xanthomonadales bacterium]|nr:DUF4845 domain-containing protein [Xanthomonadales bacterium]